MTSRIITAVLALAGFLAASAGFAQDKFLVQVPAQYAPNAPVGDVVKAECDIEGLIGNQVFKAVSAKYPASLQAKKPEAGADSKFLMLTVLSVHGVGGGGWSGPKSISIRADLMQGGKPIATKVLDRSSTGGAF